MSLVAVSRLISERGLSAATPELEKKEERRRGKKKKKKKKKKCLAFPGRSESRARPREIFPWEKCCIPVNTVNGGSRAEITPGNSISRWIPPRYRFKRVSNYRRSPGKSIGAKSHFEQRPNTLSKSRPRRTNLRYPRFRNPDLRAAPCKKTKWDACSCAGM
ncbi:hypothetical protein K0M31_000758 [Melipona bicolor]|uniref:Uncharacterized protein n=1 Tax=Melipona bicolor TaxID=60889 RepID=A0AA40GE76_9HYME|nr:hypothetical protein K0M31_000758 [Melipona bicolor]